MLGIELNSPPVGVLKENMAPAVISHLLNKHGLLTIYCDLAPLVLRFEPPLTVTKE